MANKEYAPLNEFEARGVISSIEQGKYGGRILNMYVKERRKDLKLVVNLERGVGRGITPYDHVIVKGYVKAFRYHNDSLDKDSDVMFLTATKVERARSELGERLGMDIGRFSSEPIFRGYIVGKVLEATKKDGSSFGLLRIETCGGGLDLRASRPTIKYFLKGRLPAFNYEPGDVVGLRFSVSTPEYETRAGRKVVYQSLAVEDIGFVVPKKRPEPEKKPPIQEGVMSEAEIESALLEDTLTDLDEVVIEAVEAGAAEPNAEAAEETSGAELVEMSANVDLETT